MKKVIFDCDSTVGLPKKPMDDALALLYLLGRPDKAKILGITCTFGNGTAREVYRSTSLLLKEIKREDIPLLPGADADENPISPAARYIADTVNASPNEISIIAIGSLTNLYGAWLIDNTIFEKTKEIVLMGGYTGPVIYHGISLDELNFSANYKAAAAVLNSGKNISILTGGNTLEPSLLPREEFMQNMSQGSDAARYIADKCGYRFDDQHSRYGNAISYCWDGVAAVYLLHPELFEDAPTHCCITEHAMKAGWLAPTEQAVPCSVCLNLPRVKDCAQYRNEIYAGWLNFKKGNAI